jgi:hypothetical protein
MIEGVLRWIVSSLRNVVDFFRKKRALQVLPV